ncbi:MAG: aldo/keto reductase [Planctomycetota bacterium]|nr:aldo/keto reductase [Planctomycetota bacterium]
MSEERPASALRRRALGNTGLNVGEIGFGAWAIGGGARLGDKAFGYGDTDDQASLAALARAFELGVNLVDTADSYGHGHSELLVGKAIRQAPRRVFVATKVGAVRRDPEPPRKDFSPAYIEQACERSLHRLGVTGIDLYQLHNPPREVIEDPAVWNALRELKDKGRIHHYGISIGRPDEGLLAIEKGEVETIQVVYNLLEREAAEKLFAKAERHGVGLIVRVPLASGLLSGAYKPGHVFAENDHRRDKYPPDRLARALERVEKLAFLARGAGRTPAQAALKFCLVPDAVSVVIPGAKTAKQVEENVSAASAPDITAEELQRILEV